MATVFAYSPSTLIVDHHGYPFDAGAVAVARRLPRCEGVTYRAQWHTSLQDSLWVSWCQQKKQQMLCCWCAAVAAQAALGLFLPLTQASLGWDHQVALLGSLLRWCFCQWITPTGVNAAERHSIGIIHQNSSRAFCIILFALMLFENLRGLKLANTFCRWIKWGREAQISTLKYHKAACHPHVNAASYFVSMLSSADVGFSVFIRGFSTMVSTEKSRPFHSCIYCRAF